MILDKKDDHFSCLCYLTYCQIISFKCISNGNELAGNSDDCQLGYLTTTILSLSLSNFDRSFVTNQGIYFLKVSFTLPLNLIIWPTLCKPWWHFIKKVLISRWYLLGGPVSFLSMGKATFGYFCILCRKIVGILPLFAILRNFSYCSLADNFLPKKALTANEKNCTNDVFQILKVVSSVDSVC